MKTKFVNTLRPITVMKKLSKMLEDSMKIEDEEYFYDRMYFMKHNYDNDNEVYRSNKSEDKLQVIDYDLESVNILINQILRFGRIVYSSDNSNIYNFPKNEKPKFYIKDIFGSKKTNTIEEKMKLQRN